MISQINIDDYSRMSANRARIFGILSLIVGVFLLIGGRLVLPANEDRQLASVIICFIFIINYFSMKHKRSAILMAIELKRIASIKTING